MINNRDSKGRVVVGNKYVIKLLKKYGVYGTYVKVVKKVYKNQINSMKLHLFCANGMASVDYAFTWANHSRLGVDWAEIDMNVENECRANEDEYEKGWIYKDS